MFMKKVFLALCSAALCLVLFVSCEPVVSGTFVYSLTPAENTPTGLSMTYQLSGAEDTMDKCLLETATHFSVGFMTFQKSGELKDCDRAMKAAFEKGVKQVEADIENDELFTLKDLTIHLTRSDWEDTSKKIVVAEYTFKN